MNLSPAFMLTQLRSAFLYAVGRGKPSDLFSINVPSFWQAVWGSWIIHLLATSFATTLMGFFFFVELSIIALVSSLSYILLVAFLMRRIDKADLFLKVIIPYQWLTAFQALCFGIIALIVLVVPSANAHALIIPVLIWVVYRTWRLFRDEMGITGGLAVGFILARILLDAVINLVSGNIMPIS